MADPLHQTTESLHLTRNEADAAAEALHRLALRNRSPVMKHVAKCLRALSAGAIKAIWVEEGEWRDYPYES